MALSAHLEAGAAQHTALVTHVFSVPGFLLGRKLSRWEGDEVPSLAASRDIRACFQWLKEQSFFETPQVAGFYERRVFRVQEKAQRHAAFVPFREYLRGLRGKMPPRFLTIFGEEPAALAAFSEAGVDLEHRATSHGLTALHLAVILGRHSLAKKILDEGANANSQDANGWTPLHFACLSGDEKMQSLLRENGADPMSRNRRNSTAEDLVILSQLHRSRATVKVERGGRI